MCRAPAACFIALPGRLDRSRWCGDAPWRAIEKRAASPGSGPCDAASSFDRSPLAPREEETPPLAVREGYTQGLLSRSERTTIQTRLDPFCLRGVFSPSIQDREKLHEARTRDRRPRLSRQHRL